MPRPKFESKVDSFVAEGARPQTLRHGGVVLRGQDGLFVTLVKPGAGLTNAGAYYQRRHGELDTQGLDLSQVPHREKKYRIHLHPGEEESDQSLGRTGA
jgi:hypothetical protein